MQKLLTFFSKNISIYPVFNDQRFNDTLTNDIVSFEQLGPVIFSLIFLLKADDCQLILSAKKLICLKRQCGSLSGYTCCNGNTTECPQHLSSRCCQVFAGPFQVQ